MERYTPASLAPDCSRFVVEIAVAEVKKYKSPGSYQIFAESFQA
jgi:hypothetical protein